MSIFSSSDQSRFRTWDVVLREGERSSGEDEEQGQGSRRDELAQQHLSFFDSTVPATVREAEREKMGFCLLTCLFIFLVARSEGKKKRKKKLFFWKRPLGLFCRSNSLFLLRGRLPSISRRRSGGGNIK